MRMLRARKTTHFLDGYVSFVLTTNCFINLDVRARGVEGVLNTILTLKRLSRKLLVSSQQLVPTMANRTSSFPKSETRRQPNTSSKISHTHTQARHSLSAVWRHPLGQSGILGLGFKERHYRKSLKR